MAIRCICVDDELHARQGVKLALEPYSDFKLAGMYASADEALSNNLVDIDVAFLDIEMPRKNGFALLEEWPEPKPQIVFITAYSDYAIKAFENNALDYLLKPINEIRFASLIEKIRGGVGQRNSEAVTKELLRKIDSLKTQLIKNDREITVKSDDGYSRVRLADVLYIEGIGDHVCLHLRGGQLITRSTLKKYVVDLAENDFVQTHKSFLVNCKHVENAQKMRFGDYLLRMSDGLEVKLSRRYKAAIERFTSAN